MKKIKFPKSLRKYIRGEKSRIKKEITFPKEIKEKIEEVYKKISGKKKS